MDEWSSDGLNLLCLSQGDGFQGTKMYGDVNVPERRFAVKFDDVTFDQVPNRI